MPSRLQAFTSDKIAKLIAFFEVMPFSLKVTIVARLSKRDGSFVIHPCFSRRFKMGFNVIEHIVSKLIDDVNTTAVYIEDNVEAAELVFMYHSSQNLSYNSKEL